MAANPINVVGTLLAVQYDGTNSADIIALDEFDFNNSSEVNGVWTFQSPPDSTQFTINTNDWILYAQNQVMLKNSANEFALQYSCNSLCPDVEGVATALETLSALTAVRALGVAAIPPLILNQTANVDVTLQPAMPDDAYDAYASVFAGVSLSNLVINSVTVVDEDTVTVAVQNTGIGTIAGASLMVHAVA